MTSPVDARAVATPEILEFVETALAQKELSGICEMLRAASKAVGAWGSFLWQATEDCDFSADPPTGSLFVLAGWFPDDKTWAFERLELEGISGHVVRHGRPMNMRDALDNPFPEESLRSWIAENGVHSYCSVPVAFADAKAALSFYRIAPKPFTQEELELAAVIGRLFPSLYQSIRNEVSFNLLRQIEELTVAGTAPDRDSVQQTLQKVCDLLASTFHCFETSIFVEDRLRAPGVYEQIATTWPKDDPKQTPRYRIGEPGFTPWILEKGRSVRLFNLASFQRGIGVNPNEYPGLVWNDPLDLVTTTARRRKLSEQQLPPLSYMAAPVIVGGKVLGVIRCCAALTPPYFFSNRELRLLQLVAPEIGHFWDNWMRRREMLAETESWKLFIDTLRGLNERVEAHLVWQLPDEAAIERECRELSERAGAQSMRDLLSQQTRLFRLLYETIRSRLSAEESLRRASAADRQFYEDLFHQIKSPIFAAGATARIALGGDSTKERYRGYLLTMRGQLLKAERVTRTVQLFAALLKGREPQPGLAPLDWQALLKALVWAAEDFERLFEDRHLRFSVDRTGILSARNLIVLADFDLVLHAVNNLLDNAGKYSFPGGTVRVFAGLTGAGKFHISVANHGFRLRPGEASLAVNRGWRSDEARAVTGEGSGLGLWIVDQIMKAHDGRVLIQCPNVDDEFEVKLLFRYIKA
jgi:signal transduction histidine kinase